MPKIIIREIDNTKSPAQQYSNFTVVVPGPVKARAYVAAEKAFKYGGKTVYHTESSEAEDDKGVSIFDCNGWAEISSLSDFEDTIGKSAMISNIQQGNQIAHELLRLGYTVIYKNVEGDDGITKLGQDSFWTELRDKSTYDFRYVMNGLIANNKAANAQISLLAKHRVKTDTGRGDCTALCDIDYSKYTPGPSSTMSEVIAAIEAEAKGNISGADRNTAYFANRVTYNPSYEFTKDEEYSSNMTFPASFHYLACAARASLNFAEWYAVSGYTRGISDYSIASIEVNLGDAAVDALQPRHGNKATDGGDIVAVNIVVKDRNNYYLWGNRTAEKLEVDSADATADTLKASHFLNIRQLCSTLKKQLYLSSKQYSFEPNSDTLWINFKTSITKLLDIMKADQGIRDYKVTKVNNNKKAMLTAKVRIVPIEAVEDFDIGLYLEDSIAGADISESEVE